jgi:dTDP-4-dehydrorhamnose 3,5-epimerase
MKAIKTLFEDAYLFEVETFHDERGLFYESFNSFKFIEELKKMQIPFSDNFYQDNISISSKDVLRGLHFQTSPYSQGKFIKVFKGSIFDVIVDLRLDSPTFGKWESFNLNSENNLALWIPKGFAHGFISLEDNTIVSYKASNPYKKDYERTIIWNDDYLKIKWPCAEPIISEKDDQGSQWTEMNFEKKSEYNK